MVDQGAIDIEEDGATTKQHEVKGMAQTEFMTSTTVYQPGVCNIGPAEIPATGQAEDRGTEEHAGGDV